MPVDLEQFADRDGAPRRTSASRLWTDGDCAERLLVYHSLAVPECPSEPVFGDTQCAVGSLRLWR
jgi:hypothetical protein